MHTETVRAANGSSALANTTPTGVAEASAYTVVPHNFSELHAFCKLIADSDLAPKDYAHKPGNVLVAVQMGAEIGLKPMQALQNIAVINGRPSVWGDAALGLIKQHPMFVSCEETIKGEKDDRAATCTMVRKGEPPITRTFSVIDAKRAGLWDKTGPWKTYPDRMLQMRARGFAGRDAFPDALKGLSFAEEAMDIPVTETPATEPSQSRTETVRAKILGSATVEPAAAAEPEDVVATETADDEKVKRRDLRRAIGESWQHVSEPIRQAVLTREYAKGSLLDLTTSQLEDFLARTPDLLPRNAVE